MRTNLFIILFLLFSSPVLGQWSLDIESGLGIPGLPISDNLSFKGGYRILEGGADVDEVYNFTLINFASAGLIWILE